MKRYLLVFCSITVTIMIATILSGCTDLQTSSTNNTEVVIDGNTFPITSFWVKENGFWVYHNETKSFPFNVVPEYYPEGGEYGYSAPTDSADYLKYIYKAADGSLHTITSVSTADGSLYLTKDNIINLDSSTIRITHYWVREAVNSRWYYGETKDIPIQEARITPGS